MLNYILNGVFIFSLTAGISNDWLAWNVTLHEVAKALQQGLGSGMHDTQSHSLLDTYLEILGLQFPRKLGSTTVV